MGKLDHFPGGILRTAALDYVAMRFRSTWLWVVMAVLISAGCERTGRKIDNAAEKTGKAVKKAGEKTGKAVKKAGKKTGEAVKKTGEKIEETFD